MLLVNVASRIGQTESYERYVRAREETKLRHPHRQNCEGEHPGVPDGETAR